VPALLGKTLPVGAVLAQKRGHEGQFKLLWTPQLGLPLKIFKAENEALFPKFTENEEDFQKFSLGGSILSRYMPKKV